MIDWLKLGHLFSLTSYEVSLTLSLYFPLMLMVNSPTGSLVIPSLASPSPVYPLSLRFNEQYKAAVLFAESEPEAHANHLLNE